MRLADKVALITGAASGIGRATAETFAREGAAVVVVDIDADRGKDAAEAIASSGGTAVFFRADCGIPGEIEAMTDFVRSEFGRLDILHNNHFFMAPGRAGDVSLESWQKALDINVTGYWYAIKCALESMTTQGAGCILNTASVAGLTADWGLAAYSSVKAAIVNLTRVVAIEYARAGVRCNAVCPGPISSRSKLPSIVRDRLPIKIPMGRAGTPQEVANAALFLVSDEASFITGEILVVDGGMYAAAGFLGPDTPDYMARPSGGTAPP